VFEFAITKIFRSFVAILDEANAIMRQMSNDTNTRKSENAMRDVLKSARHILAIDAFANKSTLAFLKAYRDEDIHIVDNGYQPCKCVAFVSTGAVMAKVLVEKASKLSKPDNSPVRAHTYYGNMDGKQRQKDFSDINIA
ncbi:17646_t:CDS:2, partial [Funneliformis geosporum]